MAFGCASTSEKETRTESPNPMTQQVASSQQASAQALRSAEEAQKQATDQAGKAAQAQAKVQQDQVQLRNDQDLARQESAKAQQVQAQATQEREAANRQLQQQQQVAEKTLSQLTREVSSGQQTAAGIVTQVRPDEVVIQPATGEALSIRLSNETKIQIAGQKSSAGKIKAGQHARVSYKPSADGPMAVSIAVGKAGKPSTATGTGSSSSGSAQQGQ
jgi:hypothetical protein